MCLFGSAFPAQCCTPWYHISSLSSFMHTFHCTTLDRLSDEGCINYYYFTVSSEVNQRSRILLYTVLKSSFSIHSTMFAMSDRSGWPVHVQTFSSLTVSNAMAVLWKQKYERKQKCGVTLHVAGKINREVGNSNNLRLLNSYYYQYQQK